MPIIIFPPYSQPSTSGAGDLSFDKVTFLLSGESVVDQTGKSTLTGSLPVVSTAQKKFGNNSLYFDGTKNIFGSNKVLSFGTGNFTAEGWFYQTGGGDWKTIFANRNNITDTAGTLSASISASQQFVLWGQGSLFQSAANAVPLNQWVYFAVVRNGTTLTSYINGISIGAVTNNHNFVDSPFAVGSTTNGVQTWAGYMDGLRIISGVALYSANFTPPTSPFPDATGDQYASNVVLLMHMDDASFTDVKGKVITNTGSVTTSSVSRSGTSAAFATSDQALRVAYSSDFAFGSGDFTVELWVNPTSYHGGVSALIANKRPNVVTECAWQIRMNSNGTLVTYLTNGSADIILTGNSTVVPLNSWSHIALCRVGVNIRMFINGVVVSTVTVADGTPINPGTQPLWIGAVSNDATYTVGYIDEIRITKGVGRYTETFAVPSSPFPNP